MASLIGSGGFGFGFFDVETFGGIDDLAMSVGLMLGGMGMPALGATRLTFTPESPPTDAAPGFAGALDPDADQEGEP